MPMMVLGLVLVLVGDFLGIWVEIGGRVDLFCLFSSGFKWLARCRHEYNADGGFDEIRQ